MKSLAIETGMSESKVKRALEMLRKEGYLVTDVRFYEGKRTNLIRMSNDFYTRITVTPLRDSGTLVYGTTVGMVKRVETALVLSQLCYWSSSNQHGRCRMRVYRNGFHWMAKTIEELAEEIGLRPRQVRTALSSLAEVGIVIKDHFIFNGRRMLHLRLDAEVFSDFWTRQKMLEYGG
jgi:DNA-binding Lrp family transcriptional regulator